MKIAPPFETDSKAVLTLSENLCYPVPALPFQVYASTREDELALVVWGEREEGDL